MPRFTCIILALILVEICEINGLKIDDFQPHSHTANRGLGSVLRKDHNIINMLRNHHGDTNGWTNEYRTNFKKRDNVKKWWWLLYTNGNRQKQQKWKKGSASLVCYFKVCAVPAV